MNNVLAILPTNFKPHSPAPPSSSIPYDALIASLRLSNNVALTRYVRTDDAAPKIGVLWPDEEDGVLYWAQLAVAEDVREFEFESLKGLMEEVGAAGGAVGVASGVGTAFGRTGGS